MNNSHAPIKYQHAPSEDLFRDQLINHMVSMWAAMSVAGVTLAQIRALEMGWTARDLVYFIVLGSSLITAFYRRKISMSCITILNYRRSMGKLLVEVNKQRDELDKTNRNLQRALNEIKTLRGILPLCSFCKKIRNDKGYWEQVDVDVNTIKA